MSTKKKIIISISSICLVFVIAVITIIAVFAASKQDMDSQIGVTYKATNVNVTIAGDYMLKGDNSYTSMGAPIEFHTVEGSQTKTISVNGINLSDTKRYAILRYTFTNTSNTAKIKISTHIIKRSGTTNVRVASAYSTDPVTKNYNLISAKNLSSAVLGGNSTAYVYVKVDISDISLNAAFEGNINFELEYTTETEITGTMGIAKVGDTIEMGEYPQSFVGSEMNDVLYNAFFEDLLVPTTRTYTIDVDGSDVVCDEYMYENELYVMLEGLRYSGEGVNRFTTGETVGVSGSHSNFEDGYEDALFFKVEPIEFLVVDIDEASGEMTLWSDKVLGSKYFDLDTNRWSGSELRDYLNDKFLNDSNLEYDAKQVTITNNEEGVYDEETGWTSADKIWLPSFLDFNDWYPDYLFEPWMDAVPDDIYKQATDFALATYSFVGDGICNYLLRSAGAYSHNVCVFYYALESFMADVAGIVSTDYGLCPAMVVDMQ